MYKTERKIREEGGGGGGGGGGYLPGKKMENEGVAKKRRVVQGKHRNLHQKRGKTR